MATPQQIQQALQSAQQAGNQQDVAALQQALQQSQQPQQQAPPPQQAQQQPQQAQAGPSRDQLSQAFYAAQQAGDHDSASKIIGYVQQHGMTIAPMNAQQLQGVDQQAATNTAQGMTFPQQLETGLGKSFVDTARGAGQLVGIQPSPDPQTADAALMNTGGGITGDIAGQGLQMALLGGAGGVAARGLGVAAKAIPFVESTLGSGAVSGLQPVAQDGSHLANAGKGAALGLAGQGIASGLGALASKAAPVISDAKQAAIQTLRNAGVPLHFSNLTDSKFGQYAASAANALPFSGGGASGAAQQDAFNAAIAKTFGQNATSISPDVINTATKQTSNQYNTLFARNTVNITPEVKANLEGIVANAWQDAPDFAPVVQNQVNKFMKAAAANGGKIPGRTYQNIRAELFPLEGKPGGGYFVKQVRQAMQKAVGGSFQPDDAQALQSLNGQHANLQIAKKALTRVSGANYDVQPSSLWSLINSKYGATPEMKALAQAGQAVLKDNARDSGTAIRNQIYKAIIPAAGGASLFGGAPAALSTLGAMAGTGATVGRFLNSQLAAKVLPGIGAKTLNGLSKLAAPAPYVLPAVYGPK